MVLDVLSPDFVGLNLIVFDLLQMQVALFCTSAVALLFSSLQEEIVSRLKAKINFHLWFG
jgi:hypothetical protein